VNTTIIDLSITMSSKNVINAVAEKINYYMEVQRKEDGFDLSGTNHPKLTYPGLRSGPLLSNGKLHDRSLKHYFTPSMIKTQIANLEAMPPGTPRQRNVKNKLRRSIKRKSGQNRPDVFSEQHLNMELYSAQMEALRILENETKQRLKKRLHQTTPRLRSSVSPKISKSETSRLINRSSQILVATETVALAHNIIAQRHASLRRPQSAPALQHQQHSLPGLYDSPPRPRTARGRVNAGSTPGSRNRRPKYDLHTLLQDLILVQCLIRYAWDLNGHRIPYRDISEDTIEDSNSSLSTYSSTSDDIDHYTCRPRSSGPRRHRMRPSSRQNGNDVFLLNNPHLLGNYRPHSPAYPHNQHLIVESTPRQTLTPDSGFCINTGTQTSHIRPSDVRHNTTVHHIPYSEDTSHDEYDGRPLQLTKYTVTVKTGDKLGAGTTADIYLSLHGENGDTDEIYLTERIEGKNREHKTPFRRNQVDVFEIECENVGQLHKLGIGHNQKSKGSSWFVDYVSVKLRDQVWKFTCGLWLSGVFGRQKTLRHIPIDHQPSESETSDTNSSTTTVRSSTSEKPRRKKLTRKKSKSSSSSSSEDSKSSSDSSRKNKLDAISVKNPPEIIVTSERQVDHSDDARDEDPPRPSFVDPEEVQSKVEYSAESSADERSTLDDEKSFVEESQDSSDQSSDEDTLTDRSEDSKINIDSKDTKPFIEETKSHTSRSSSSSSFVSFKKLILKSSSSSSDSSSEETEPPQRTKRSPSIAESTPITDAHFPNHLTKVTYSEAEVIYEVDGKDEVQATKPEILTEDQPDEEQSQDERKRSSSESSSSNSSSSSEGASIQINEEVTQQVNIEEETEEKAEVFMDGFNAGLAASRKISVTHPELLEESPRHREIDESSHVLLDEEEGSIQSPRQPVVRSDVHNVIKEDSLASVVELINLRPELREKESEKGWTPIHVAATYGKIDVLQWLTATGANLEAETPTGYTSMHMAAMHGHIKCLMVLHAMGGTLDPINIDGQSPLHLSCMSNHIEVTKWLVANGANLKARDNFHRTALDLAKQYKHKEVARFLRTCMTELKNQDSSMSLLQSSKSSMGSSHVASSSSSSSDDSSSSDEEVSSAHEDEKEKPDEVAARRVSIDLEEKKKIYENQRAKMLKRKTSFLDSIRDETRSSTSSSSSDST
ncbi:uncharacterized protein LOC100180254, partial [Ciona intestinalis]